MDLKIYKKAHELQERIAALKYELSIIEQSLDKPMPIRFGTEFNVTKPVVFEHHIYREALLKQRKHHSLEIERFTTEFDEL